jgi:hypothetical protein
MRLLVPISVGELLDKITILELKAAAVQAPAARANIARELAELEAARRRELPQSAQLEGLLTELREVNARLWQIEDELRRRERDGDFDAGFVALARRVYHENDRRAAIKRRINEMTGSAIVEEKLYRR